MGATYRLAMTALTIGKFESIHRGHQRLIAEVVRCAKKEKAEPIAVTFDPHPRRVLGDPTYCLLFTFEERSLILRGMGVDKLVTYPFDEAFMAQAPEEFCSRLIDEHRPSVIVLGQCFRFGRNRSGTVETLQKYASMRNIIVKVVPHAFEGEKKISTSDIRACIGSGLLPEAEALLGFPFFIMGKVAHGKKLGHTLGFPTVNIQPPEDKLLPPDGVYATCVQVEHQLMKGITNVGLRPSAGTNTARTVETFLIGFDGDLYGENLCINFHHFIRPERKFDSLRDLREQIVKDVERRLGLNSI